jgi:hypothetical protein
MADKVDFPVGVMLIRIRDDFPRFYCQAAVWQGFPVTSRSQRCLRVREPGATATILFTPKLDAPDQMHTMHFK